MQAPLPACYVNVKSPAIRHYLIIYTRYIHGAHTNIINVNILNVVSLTCINLFIVFIDDFFHFVTGGNNKKVINKV